MISLIVVVCILGFNVDKVDPLTTEHALYAYEIVDEKKNKAYANIQK